MERCTEIKEQLQKAYSHQVADKSQKMSISFNEK